MGFFCAAASPQIFMGLIVFGNLDPPLEKIVDSRLEGPQTFAM